MQTRAAILYKTNAPLVIEEIETPPLGLGQVLVRMAFSGLCHSQINEIRGRRGKDKFLPHTLGHEGSGVVHEVGSGVTKVKQGDHVVLTWIRGEGKDVPSCTYKRGSKKINSGAISTFANYAVVSENRLVPIPKAIPLDHASLLGCAIPTGGGIIRHAMQPSPGSSIAIFGAGGVGMSALLTASGARCKPIIVVDIHSEKLTFASKLGAHVTINAKTQNTLACIQKATQGQGVDFAIETAGVKAAMETAFQAVRDNGGLAVIAGNLAAGEKISLDPFDLIKGKRIIGTWGGQANPDKDIPWYINQYKRNRLPLDKLITHRFTLDKINSAVTTLEGKGNIIRALITYEDK